MKKIVALSTAVLFTMFLFISCKTDDGETTIKNFIKDYYTVNQSDYNYYKQMNSGTKISGIAKFDKSYESHTKKFKQYLSAEAYQEFYATRVSYLRIEEAYKNGYFVKLNSINIIKKEKDEDEKTIIYKYK
ncbi:hypothetical protein, partial [Clostridium oryzae]|uniref:hypothetical protein n=1 Tax=Clostridium oryzae TaxID=1450648 RepID=UPI001115B398